MHHSGRRLLSAAFLSVLLHALALAWKAPYSPMVNGSSSDAVRVLQLTVRQPIQGGAASEIMDGPPLLPAPDRGRQAGATEGGLVAPPAFVSPELLTAKPFLLEGVEVDFPEAVPALAGLVRLRIYLTPRGSFDHAEVLESNLPEDYAAAAIASFRERRFSPGLIGSMAVGTFTEIEVEFNPVQACCF